MENRLIEEILNKAHDLFVSLGFKSIIVNNNDVFELKGKCYKFIFVNGLGGFFVIESANSIEDARKNLYEDDNTFKSELGKSVILEQLEVTLKKYYLQ